MKLDNPFAGLCIEERTETCDVHGDFVSRHVQVTSSRTDWTKCQKCLDAVTDAERRSDDAKLRAERNSSIVRMAAIPERFMNRDLSNYQAQTEEQKNALQIAKLYAEDMSAVMREGRSLIFCGRPGTGKTHLAVGIAKYAMTMGREARFTSAMNAIRMVRETYSRNSEISERQSIARFAEPDLMILDEVGSQLGTEAEKVTLFDIINARYERMRPTIVISNLGIEGVRDYLGERAFDRLRENGGKAVLFNWNSYRGQK